ncbi:LysM peptidoglycan-binding domain-containing protein [uncultured Nostoc sp.]|uniref:LysM peptidoglycan-binding domain-containing protein n=1 Tax=uncultured Nostoc sp. TaxID=340711 RepID=UPI0035C97B61
MAVSLKYIRNNLHNIQVAIVNTTPVTAKEPPKSVTYTVKLGDHLSAIAQKFCGKGTSWQVMVKANPQLKGRIFIIF